MDFVDRLANTGFLGREFLTWLWFKSDSQEGLLTIDDGGPAAEVWLTDRIVLSGAGQGAEKVTVKAEDPALSPEARMALRQGKKVEKACVRLVRGQREWTTNVDAETLALSSIKIPALLTREADEKLRERLSLLDQLDAMVVSLFQAFLAVRTDGEAWDSERRSLTAWIQNEVGPSAVRATARTQDTETAPRPEAPEAPEATITDDGVIEEVA